MATTPRGMGARSRPMRSTAAADCTAGRLATSDAARVLTAALLAAFTPPGTSVPLATA